MTTNNSYFSYRIILSLRIIAVLILAGCALWFGLRALVNHPKTVAPGNPLPELSGQAAVEHLKQEGLYDTLAEAVAAARYNADPLPSPGAYQFSNRAQGLRATFTSSGTRVVSSNGGREQQLTIRLIGYGYGSRMTELDSQNIVARQNRIEQEYSIRESATRNPQSSIKEWFVNSAAGIEHGFTLPEPPPAERGGDEALRVELEIGGDFKSRLDVAGQAVSFACGRCSGGALTYDKLRVYDARNREVAARFELEGKRLAIVVDESEAEYPVTIDPLFARQARLAANDGLMDDRFGGAVAISGDTVVVGAPGANSSRGAVYIFARSGTTWSEQQKLTASDGGAFQLFGASVAIDGNTVAVGATMANNIQGAAYIFARSGTTWNEQQKLTPSNGAAFDQFGSSIAINGDTVAVGAPTTDIGANEDQGSVYIFARSGTTWNEQQTLTASDGSFLDIFGASVAISMDTLVVGAIGPISFSFQGGAYIFTLSGTTWNEQQKLTASDGAASDFFGVSVAMSGDTVAVGAHQDTIGVNAGQGSVYIFVRRGTTWNEQQKLTASDGGAFEFFGISVAISGDTVAVGAPLATNGLGATYVFARSGTTWTLQQKLTVFEGEQFGISVAISSDTVVAGAPLASSGLNFRQGAAYVFVPCPVIIISPTDPDLPEGTVGMPYGQTFTASAGIAPFVFTVTGESPPGLILNNDGTLSGTPNSFGTFTFTVRATDSGGCTGEMAYTVTISPSAFATVSAASFTPTVAAKEIVAGFGVSLANTTAFASSLPLPLSLEGTSVMVKDSAGVERASPLYFISPLQINYQIPADTALGAVIVSVFIDQVLVAAGPLQIVTSAPSIFTLNTSGSGPAAALDAITFQPAPFNATQADGSPNFIVVFGTGLGADVTDGGGNISASVQALIDGNPVTVTYAGQAPFLVGANQFNIQFPVGITSGEHRLTISRGGATSNPVTIAIR